MATSGRSPQDEAGHSNGSSTLSAVIGIHTLEENYSVSETVGRVFDESRLAANRLHIMRGNTRKRVSTTGPFVEPNAAESDQRAGSG